MRTTPFLLALCFAAIAASLNAQEQPGAVVTPPPAPAAPPVPAVVVGEVAPATGAAAMSTDALGRDTVSVDFPDEDIRTLLLSISELFDLNIIVPETLQGRTSIKLRDVTWRQIFTNVLGPVGYTYIEEGNIVKVVSNESRQLEPTTIEVIALEYATAATVLPIITQMVDTNAGGRITTDTRTNLLIITERPSRMGQIRAIIEQLDIATDQVTIETKFVEVTDGDIRDIGINWSALQSFNVGAQGGGQLATSRGQSGGISSDTSAANNSNQDLSSSNTTTFTTPSTNTATTTGATALASSAQSAFNMLQTLANTTTTDRDFAAVFSADQFSLVLSALNTLSTTRIVSNPTVTTLNNKLATINVGTRFPVPNFTFNEQTGTFAISGFAFEEIGINLNVTPQVNARGFITLTINPEVSQLQGTSNFEGAEIPIIASRRASTNVSMQSGDTIGLGGLLTSRSVERSNRIPVLGDIPLLGRVFRNSSQNTETTNLLIFITARAIDARGAPIGEVFDPRQIRQMGLQPDDLPGFRDGSDPFAPAPTAP
jgi:type IV pilus assembly protein PilQ